MAPQKGFLKFNVDGSAVGKPGPAGIGGILRDEEGTVKPEFSKSIGGKQWNALLLLNFLSLLLSSAWLADLAWPLSKRSVQAETSTAGFLFVGWLFVLSSEVGCLAYRSSEFLVTDMGALLFCFRWGRNSPLSEVWLSRRFLLFAQWRLLTFLRLVGFSLPFAYAGDSVDPVLSAFYFCIQALWSSFCSQHRVASVWVLCSTLLIQTGKIGMFIEKAMKLQTVLQSWSV
ncbi:hypothetical protein REPUB_Repub05bG0061200 [Reevesia pubescens]